MHQPSRCIKVHLHAGIQTPNPGWSISESMSHARTKQSFFPQSWFGGKMMATFKKMFLEEFFGITCDGQRGFCRVKSVARKLPCISWTDRRCILACTLMAFEKCFRWATACGCTATAAMHPILKGKRIKCLNYEALLSTAVSLSASLSSSSIGIFLQSC